MAIPQVVSGVGANAKRVDKNNVERVQRIQNNAQIAQASGGAYGDRVRNENLVAQSPLPPTASSTGGAPAQSGFGRPMPSSDIFAPGTSGNPLSDAAPGGPGRGAEAQSTPIDDFNQNDILARAMLAANPTSTQLFMLVEAYNEIAR